MQEQGKPQVPVGSSPTSDRILDEFTAGYVRKRARQLAGKFGFRRRDRDEIEQRLYLKLARHLDAADSEDPKWKAFVAKTVNRHIASMIRDNRAEKRDHRRVCTIHVVIGEDDDGTIELADTIGEQEGKSHRGSTTGMDFRIVIDTREQAEYSFPCETVRRKLDAGDYSVVGLEQRVAVERKSLPDFVHTVIHDFDRFANELEKLASMDAACVVVEADLDSVLRSRHSDALRTVSPQSLLGIALHIGLRWHVPVHWCGSRQAACAFTDAFLRTFVRVSTQAGGVRPSL